jgi:predicted glycosyltransferase
VKIVFYCQHVLGIGHFFRSLEICRALDRHEVILVTGGTDVNVSLPRQVSEVRLPALGMDRDFKGLRASGGEDLETIRQIRRERILSVFDTERPELFLIELYPFGRKAFRFEIDPVLEAMAAGRLPPCGVVCSVRDILVEKEEQRRHETRAVDMLNRYFDAVLVHADPKLIRLEETFGRLSEISVPLIYTGFITPMPAADSRKRIRSALGLADRDRLIVASAGGGSVGAPLLEAAVVAFGRLGLLNASRLLVFTGPFLPEEDFDRLRHMAGEGVAVERFTPDFLDVLAAADLSVSMAGYNTTMNLLAAQVPALVWPFGQNREQRLRSERLESLGALRILRDEELAPAALAACMEGMLMRPGRPSVELDLNGAQTTARWIGDWRPPAAGRPAL